MRIVRTSHIVPVTYSKQEISTARTILDRLVARRKTLASTAEPTASTSYTKILSKQVEDL